MKEWKQSLLRVQEDGMEAIEGLLVITLTLFVLFFIWGYGFLLFQQFVVIRAADETANKIAQTYAYAERPDHGIYQQRSKSCIESQPLPKRKTARKKRTACHKIWKMACSQGESGNAGRDAGR